MENLKFINYDHRGNRTSDQEKEQELIFENSLKGLKDEFIQLGGFVQIEYNEKNITPKITFNLNDGNIGDFMFKLHSKDMIS